MSIYKVNNNLPRNQQIAQVNDMILEVNGKVEQGKFDINEIAQLFSDFDIDRKYLRNQGIGGTITTYSGWSHLKAEDGYSIWKYTPTSYLYNATNKMYFDNIVLENRGLASSESATAFDKVYTYNGDSGSGYTDVTSEAATEEGSEFEVMDSTADYLYMGMSSTFSGSKFEWQTRGSNYTLVVEYYNGSGWTTMTANANDLDDDTSNFESDGKISWTIPGDWATTTVSTSGSLYFIRISTSTLPVTTAKAYYIIPYNSVPALLALSSTQINEETWAWCTYGSSVYVTIRNVGQSAYEGNYYVTSSSSTANKKNFFIYNHTYLADYQDSTYGISNSISLGDGASDDNKILIADIGQSGTQPQLRYNVTTSAWQYSNDGSVFSNIGAGGGSQNLWETITADSGSAVAASTTDTFNILGGTGIGTSITGDSVTIVTVDGEIDHDALNNYLANEHIDWTGATQALSTSGDATVGDNVNVGDGTTGSDKVIYANNGDANKPGLRYYESSNVWQYSNDGLVWNNISAGAGAQNLWATFTGDSGSATANTTTDTFNILGGTGISTAISGDTITLTTIDWTNAINNFLTIGTGQFRSSLAIDGNEPELNLIDDIGGEWSVRNSNGNFEIVDNSVSGAAIRLSMDANGHLVLQGEQLWLGDGNVGDNKIIYANNGDANKPALRYNESTNSWQYSNDGSAFSDIGSGGGASGTRGTFDDGDLTAGVLTLTHNQGLSTPFTLLLVIADNNQEQIASVDKVTFLTNTITVDMSSFGTLTGTWGYYYI